MNLFQYLSLLKKLITTSAISLTTLLDYIQLKVREERAKKQSAQTVIEDVAFGEHLFLMAAESCRRATGKSASGQAGRDCLIEPVSNEKFLLLRRGWLFK